MQSNSTIIGGLSEFKEERNPEGKSITNRIREAKTAAEINHLLKVGSSYKDVSLKTMKMWAKEAAAKLEIIGS